MAIINGPLHSDAARGQFAKQIIFQHRRGSTVAKAYKAPNEPNTPAQLAVQQRTKLLTKRWATLTTDEKTTWLPVAQDRGTETINAYVKENWERLQRGDTITDVWPPANAPTKKTFAQRTFAPRTFAPATLNQ